MLIILQKETNFLREEQEELEKYWKQKKLLIKLVEKWTELLIKPPEETGLYLIEPEELEKFLSRSRRDC